MSAQPPDDLVDLEIALTDAIGPKPWDATHDLPSDTYALLVRSRDAVTSMRGLVDAIDAWDLAREKWKDKDGHYADPARVYRERVEPLLQARRR